jgi:hypothetical protein
MKKLRALETTPAVSLNAGEELALMGRAQLTIDFDFHAFKCQKTRESRVFDTKPLDVRCLNLLITHQKSS